MVKKIDKAAQVAATTTTHRDIVKLWPTVIEFADDIGVGVEAARKMVFRDSIADEHWAAVAAAAKRRKLKTAARESVTVELLAQIRAATRGRRKKKSPIDAARDRAA